MWVDNISFLHGNRYLERSFIFFKRLKRVCTFEAIKTLPTVAEQETKFPLRSTCTKPTDTLTPTLCGQHIYMHVYSPFSYITVSVVKPKEN